MSLGAMAAQSGGLESLIVLLGSIALILLIDRIFLRKALDEQ